MPSKHRGRAPRDAQDKSRCLIGFRQHANPSPSTNRTIKPIQDHHPSPAGTIKSRRHHCLDDLIARSINDKSITAPSKASAFKWLYFIVNHILVAFVIDGYPVIVGIRSKSIYFRGSLHTPGQPIQKRVVGYRKRSYNSTLTNSLRKWGTAKSRCLTLKCNKYEKGDQQKFSFFHFNPLSETTLAGTAADGSHFDFVDHIVTARTAPAVLKRWPAPGEPPAAAHARNDRFAGGTDSAADWGWSGCRGVESGGIKACCRAIADAIGPNATPSQTECCHIGLESACGLASYQQRNERT